MNTSLSRNRGMTLTEIVFVAAISGVIFLALVRYAMHTMPFFQRTVVRQELMTQSRSCMNMILQQLRNGKAGTLRISTWTSLPIVPNSRVDFQLQTELPTGATAYAFYLEKGTVFAQEYVKTAPPQPDPRPLASNVTGLIFTGDSRDPGLVDVTLRIDKPWDTTNKPDHVSTILMPNQTVHMVESH